MPSKGVLTFIIMGILGLLLIGLSVPKFIEMDRLSVEYADNYDDWAAAEQQNGTLTLIDKDQYGEIGFSFYVKGTLQDLNQNGIYDHCDATSIEIVSHPEISEKLDSQKAYNETNRGGFYYMVSDGDGCKVDYYADEMYDGLAEKQGFLRVGRACYGCLAGDMTFTSNQSVWVSYDDIVVEELFDVIDESLFASFAYLCSGVFSICCGVSIFVISLFFRKEDTPPVVLQQWGTHPVVQQQMVNQNFDSSTSTAPWASLGSDDQEIGK